MSVTSGFFNSLNGDRKYTAEQMSAIFDGVINDGIFQSVGGRFFVTVSNNDSVAVATGRAWFNSTWVYNDSPLVLKIDKSESLLDRYDAVVIEVDRSDSVRNASIKVVKGIPASSAKHPILKNTSSVHQYALAYVMRKANVSVLTQANIENNVGKSSCPFVTGILKTVDTDMLISQWGAQWDEWTKAKKSDFSAWYSEIQNILSGDAATNIAKKVTDLYNKVSFNGIPTSTQEPPEKSLNKKYIKQLAEGHGILMRSNGSKFEELMLKNTPEDVYLTIPPHSPYGEYKDITLQQVLDAGAGGKSLISLLLSTAKEVTGNVITSTTENGVYTWYDKPGQPTLGGYVFVYRYGANRILRTAYGVDGNIYRCTSMLDTGKWGEWSRL